MPAGGTSGSDPSPLTTGWLLICDGATLAVSVIRVEEEGLEKVIEVETDGVVGEELEEEVVVGMLGGALLLGGALGVGMVDAAAIASSAGEVGDSTGEVGECTSAIAIVASSGTLSTITGEEEEKEGMKVGSAGDGMTIGVGPSSISISSQSLAVDLVALRAFRVEPLPFPDPERASEPSESEDELELEERA